MSKPINLRKFNAFNSLLALLILLGGGSTLLAQSNPAPPLSERILDCDQPAFILNDFLVVRTDVKNLFADLGFKSLGDSFLESLDNRGETGFDETAGAIMYSNIFPSRIKNLQLHVADADQIAENFSNDEDTKIVTGKPTILDKDLLDIPVARFFGSRRQTEVTAVETEGRLLLMDDKDSEVSKQLLTAPLLTKRLDATAKDIINRSGFSAVYNVPKESWNALGIPEYQSVYKDEFSDAEYKWIEQLADIAETTSLTLAGLKYEFKTLHLRNHAQFKQEKPVSAIVNLDQIKKDWAPDLGFVKEQLVFTAAIQMEAFRSSAAARVIPQIALIEAGKNNQMEFLQGGMLRVLTELTGDSWNDLSAARIGMYQNDADENAGQLALIGIADAKDGADVLTELRRLSLITMPKKETDAAEPNKEEKDELLRLIELVQSKDSNLANRAATRLVLAGNSAVPLLKDIDHNGNVVLQTRIRNTLRRIKLRNQQQQGDSEVIDPTFWTTLNPGLRWEEKTGTVNEFASHTIHVTPDASKTAEEVESATQMMTTFFGDKWNQIQVVEIQNRFVFLVGSDTDLLEKVVSNVANEKRGLLQPYTAAGLKPVTGQVQVCFNALRTSQVLKLPGVAGLKIEEEKIDDHRCWVGLGFEPHAASIDVLVPISQMQPFFQLAF